jgi:hypothetical protein
VPSFYAEPGKVTFLGGIKLRPWTESKYVVDFDESTTPARAQRLLSARFPALPTEILTHPLELRPTEDPC